MTVTPADVSTELARFALSAAPTGKPHDRGVATLTAVARRAAHREDDPTVVTTVAALAAEVDGPVAAFGPSVDLSAAGAALVSGVAGTRPEDTVEQRTEVAVVAAAGVAASLLDRPGPELVAAVTVGSEVGSRVVRALRASSYVARGWDVTGAGGSIGSAAAVARLLGATSTATGQALGIAATQAAGLALAGSSSAWPLLVGKAAANGLEAAWLCLEGFSGPPRGIEGRRGLLAVAAPDADAAPLLDGLGRRWDVLEQPGPVAPDEAPDLTEEVSDLVSGADTASAFVGRLRAAT